MELLWLDQHETTTALGQALVGIRGAFLSARRVRDAYLGYATQQLRKIEARPLQPARTAKHARHLARLLTQGAELWHTGRLPILLGNPQEVTAFGEQVAAGDFAVARRALTAAEAGFGGPTVLPDQPDETTVERWLLAVRAAYLPAGERTCPS